ncbi:hypothetical protein KY290_003602 [Solanum tuberosum]|uniref:Uncharacterized protein n=2 Tax=Solanum tuberosum TaxID=4113 RepID=A0ABQ7WVM0_SOLTU|nr:hypothetical protein KY284_003754 [Solanum tuberosum]KAH0784004.1 hypothetical protein KY290_003602 [Solanum tuberosum]
MGALNQKWTPEEESALKVGVLKYGTDKWRTTLKDPEYSGQVEKHDSDDKWLGSRDKARLTLKRVVQAPMQDESIVVVTSTAESHEELPGARPATTFSSSPHNGGSRRTLLRLFFSGILSCYNTILML